MATQEYKTTTGRLNDDDDDDVVVVVVVRVKGVKGKRGKGYQ